MRSVWCLLLLASAALAAQQPPQATDLPSSPFAIRKTWMIGGSGSWDYLTMDPTANRLYIAHGTQVQVIDVETGALAGRISGLHEAHAVVLDASGEFGYISDGPVNQVEVFDRRTLQIVANIPTGPTPRALVLDQQSGLLFAICTNPLTATQAPAAATSEPRRPGGATAPARTVPPPGLPQPTGDREIKTSISVIDLLTRRRVGEILMPGKLGFAQSDGNGQVFVLLIDRNQVARLDAEAVAGLLRLRSDSASANAAKSDSGSTEAAEAAPPAAGTPGAVPTQASARSSSGTQASATPSGGTSSGKSQSGAAAEESTPTVLDWSRESRPAESAQDSMRLFPIGAGCQEPRSLAIDGAHQRIFAACNNMKLAVLDAGSGEPVTSLPIGPGADTVGYDHGRGLIYTANGGAQGTLTVIHQDVTDTYKEIQNLPTRQRARTLAINPDNGQVYLVTDYQGVNVTKSGGIGTLKSIPVEGSFQVLVIGN